MIAPQEVRVPGIGDFKDVIVAEILVKPGDEVQPEQTLIVLESDKATIDVPSPFAGAIREVTAKLGDRVSEGSLIALLEALPAKEPLAAAESHADKVGLPHISSAALEREGSRRPTDDHTAVRASPAVRLLARQLNVNVVRVSGTGPSGRVLKRDVRAFVTAQSVQLPSVSSTVSESTAEAQADVSKFASFGPVDVRPLSRIQRLTAAKLRDSWASIPHVTSYDHADVTELEKLRVRLNDQSGNGIRITLLTFVVMAVVRSLKAFPQFNATLVADGLLLKNYYNVGIATDTPRGLVVPVLRNADQKGLLQIAGELADLVSKARTGGLGPADLNGGSFTISSLGGHPGTAFTPIINAPEVAILGLSRTKHQPVWDGASFQPRLLLPLSLSWDHRVIDGVAAARFTAHVGGLLFDPAQMLL